MTFCPHCQGADELFDRSIADKDLRDYRRSGPHGTTKRLLDVLRARGVDGLSLIDVGGGVGVIQHELSAAGVSSITGVDASSAYLRIAREEAERRGYADSASYVYGDFAALAGQLDPADIVTMDRVICCYPDVRALVDAAASKANRFLGVVYPRDRLVWKIGLPLANLFFRLRRTAFRIYIHPTAVVEQIAADYGLRKIAQHDGWLWQVSVYAKQPN